MVTRVDRKPILYGTTMVKLLAPSVEVRKTKNLEKLLLMMKGYGVPNTTAAQINKAREEIAASSALFGDEDSIFDTHPELGADGDAEASRLAHAVHRTHRTLHSQIRAGRLSDALDTVIMKVSGLVDNIVCGIEASYMFWYLCTMGRIFESGYDNANTNWAHQCAQDVLKLQSPSMFMHSNEAHVYGYDYKTGTNNTFAAFTSLAKKADSLLLRTHSTKAWNASAYYMGINKRGFVPSSDIELDFEVVPTGMCTLLQGVRLFFIAGLRVVVVDDHAMVMSVDDSVSVSMLGSCLSKTILYFQPANGYTYTHADRALELVLDMYTHIVHLIDGGVDFGKYIRSIHILAQKEFNDTMEDETTAVLGWETRSKNYDKESRDLDPYGAHTYKNICKLARNGLDRLNVMFLYHVLLGDEMVYTDLSEKIRDMAKKSRRADPKEWAAFLNFCDAYMLTRYMYVRKVKPKVGGNSEILSQKWADTNIAGKFTMMPEEYWGFVWIEGQIPYVKYADTWHLDCQDVSLVMKDPEGVRLGTYAHEPEHNVELIHALKYGSILDCIRGTTPKQARDRITGGRGDAQIVMTAAPKQENAKHSVKKRATFSADNETRKMQAEADRNIRRLCSFLKGPSLGADQVQVEKQMRDIAMRTALGTTSTCSSHDISAWSESEDRKQKFDLMRRMIRMTTLPQMDNLEHDWDKVACVVNKQGGREIIPIANGFFQGFDGSEATIKHSLMLLYCIHTARRDGIIPRNVKADMAVLIDDCVSLMENLPPGKDSANFWVHLKKTYLALGKEVDDLKSVYSCIKAVYLSRRFLKGGECPADFKVFCKVHPNYEDPLRTAIQIGGDTFASMRGACDAGGSPVFIYMSSLVVSFLELSYAIPKLMSYDSRTIAVVALAPFSENGWGFPSMISWVTTEVYDERVHFNAIMESAANLNLAPGAVHANLVSSTHAQAYHAIKTQPWRCVSLSSVFSDPMHAQRDGPQNPQFARASLIEEILDGVCTAQPWRSIIEWNKSPTTNEVREILVASGYLHAPTLKALANCMPDAYRQALVGKAVGSTSILELVPKHGRSQMRRRVTRMAEVYMCHLPSLAQECHTRYEAKDIAALSAIQRAVAEREEFYTLNGVRMTDHTFPDPVCTFTRSASKQRAYFCPEKTNLITWDTTPGAEVRCKDMRGIKGLYVPPRSERVWEVTNDYAKGWDPISSKISVATAVLLRAQVDGHKVKGLMSYCLRAWSETCDITLDTPKLMSIHGSIKRLDANPGSSTHPLTAYRNISSSLEVCMTTLPETIRSHSKRTRGTDSTLHDVLGHTIALRAVATVILDMLFHLEDAEDKYRIDLLVRPDMVVSSSLLRMNTDGVEALITAKILDSFAPYGLAEAAPELAPKILVCTMHKLWVKKINALYHSDEVGLCDVDNEADAIAVSDLMHEAEENVVLLSASVRIATAPRERASIRLRTAGQVYVRYDMAEPRTLGDEYQCGVARMDYHVSMAVAREQPEAAGIASVIKSAIWNEVRPMDIGILAGIFYEDEGHDMNAVRVLATEDFWARVLKACGRLSKGSHIHHILPTSLALIGLYGVRLDPTKEDTALTKQLASYAGSHLRNILACVGDYVTSIAGRRTKDFDDAMRFTVVSKHPALDNKRIREQMTRLLFKTNIDTLADRCKRLEAGAPIHKGDKRALAGEPKARLAELRCRRLMYKAVKVSEGAKVVFDWALIERKVIKAAEKSIRRNRGTDANVASMHATAANAARSSDHIQRVEEIMISVEDHVTEVSGFWNVEAGMLGIKTAASWIEADIEKVAGRNYALSPSEIMPMHYRIITHPAEVASTSTANADELSDTEDKGAVGALGRSTIEGEDVMSLEDTFAAFSIGRVKSKDRTYPIELWKALFTNIVTTRCTIKEVAEKLGRAIPQDETLDAIVDLGFIGMSNDTVLQMFPTVLGDYLAEGMDFDPEWVEETTGYHARDR